MPTRADDWLEEPTAVGSGSVTTGGSSDLGDALVDATATLARVRVLMAEATADDWRELALRIAGLREAMRAVPQRAPRRRRVGF